MELALRRRAFYCLPSQKQLRLWGLCCLVVGASRRGEGARRRDPGGRANFRVVQVRTFSDLREGEDNPLILLFSLRATKDECADLLDPSALLPLV
jgi:hypothetical protein